MAYLNKIILIGNIGKNPEVRQMQDGTKFATCSLATTKRYTDRNNQAQEQTTWHNLVFSNNLADTVGQYCHSGDMIYVEGEYVSRQYTNRDNIQVTTYEVRVQNLQLLSPRPQQPRQPQGYIQGARVIQQAQNNMPQPIMMPSSPAPAPAPAPTTRGFTRTEATQLYGQTYENGFKSEPGVVVDDLPFA